MTYHAKVVSGGKIVLPAELRRELSIKDGDPLVIDRDECGGLIVKTYAQVIKEGQRKFRAMAGDDYTVDTFLQEKRADWGENGASFSTHRRYWPSCSTSREAMSSSA